MQPTAQQLQTTGGKAVEGAWYGGQRFMGGQLLAPGQDQAGHDVSADVIAQTSPGNVGYVNAQRQNFGMTSSPSNNNPNPAPNGGGIPGLGAGAPAVPNLQALYDSSYTNNPAVLAANKAIADLQGQVTARQQARDEATKNVNDNPFYAEASRVGKISKINSEAEGDINTLTGQLSTAQGNLTNLQAESQRQVNLAQGQYSLNNQAYQQNLQEFNTLLSAGGLENASPQTLAGLSVSTGIPTDMLQSIATSQQAKNTQIITSTDNAGNVTLTAVNAQTGKVVSSTSLGGIGAAKKGSGAASTDTPAGNTKNILQSFTTDAASIQRKVVNGQNVGQFPQLVMQYAPSMSLQDIYKAYANSLLGKKYGAPTESAQDIKQIYNYYRGTPPKQTIN